jgi:hypothetical protein
MSWMPTIEEINTFEHRSPTNGVSHKCNDGHMALCGLATELYQHKPETGRVIPCC